MADSHPLRVARFTVLLPIAPVAFGITAFGLVLHFTPGGAESAIHGGRKPWMPAQASEATPSFGRLWRAMTVERAWAASPLRGHHSSLTVGLPGGFATAYHEMNWTLAWRLPMSLKGERIMGRTT